MIIELFEPPASGQISGGYRYNEQLSRHSQKVRKHSVNPESLEAALQELSVSSETLLLADSLFLTETAFELFMRWRQRESRPVGFLIHSLPSFIERAQSATEVDLAAPWLPSASERRMLQLLDLVVAPGPHIPDLLARSDVQTPTLVCLPGVPNWPSALKKRTLPREPRQIISIGAVTPNKGHLDALHALAQLKDVPFHWTILGDTQLDVAHCNALSAAIQAHEFREHISLIQQVEHAEALAMLDRSTLLLVPSYSENQPLVIMEALCLGVPVVTYDTGCSLDVVAGNGAGLVTPLRDVIALGTALRTLLTEPSRYAEASSNGLKAAQRWLSWPQSCEDLLEKLGTFLQKWAA